MCRLLLRVAAELPEGAEHAKVMFSTVRPQDYSVPYAVLEKNSVAFSAVDKRGNKLLTVMVRPAAAAAAQSGHRSPCMHVVLWEQGINAEVTGVRMAFLPTCGRDSVDASTCRGS
jgi:hypothetical protein